MAQDLHFALTLVRLFQMKFDFGAINIKLDGFDELERVQFQNYKNQVLLNCTFGKEHKLWIILTKTYPTFNWFLLFTKFNLSTFHRSN